MRQFVIILMALFALSSCSTTRLVKPLKEKEWAVGADFGGPLIQFAGAPIPIPFTTVHTAYGIDSTTSVWGSLHPTSLAFGNLQTDIGGIKQLVQPSGWKPGFSVATVANMGVNLQDGDFRIYPEIDLNLFWPYSQKNENFAYVSVSNWFDFWRSEAHGEKNETFYIPNFAVGHTFENKKMRYTIEGRWLAPFANNENLVVRYIGPGNAGTFGVYLGMCRKF